MRRVRGLVAVAVGLATFLAGPPAAWADDENEPGDELVGEAPGSESEIEPGGESGSELSGCHVRCGDTITRSIRLTHDLSCPGTGPALRIAGEGVVLDLGGHTVRRIGPRTFWSDGIVVVSNSTVRNGTIRGFERGYVLDFDISHNAEHVWLSRLTFIDNGAAVYNRGGSATFTITRSRLIKNGSGLGSEQDASNGVFEVRSTLFYGNGLALSANSHSADVTRSTFRHNKLVFWCPYGSVSFTSSWIVQNEAVGRLPAGEFGYGTCGVASFVNTVISNNGAFAPPDYPAWEPFNFVLRDSWLTDNGGGLRLRGKEVDIQDNTLWSNRGGLSLVALPDWGPLELTGTISDNRFVRNRDDGLRVEPPSTLTVSRNIAFENTGWGLYVPGVIDGGGNVARGNRAGNCVGVVCSSF